MDIPSIHDSGETTMEETDEPHESEFEADVEYTDFESEIETVEEGETPAAPVKLSEEFRGGIVRGSVDSDDDDDDVYVEEEEEEETEEEEEEEEEIEDDFDFVDEDALDQEVLANTLNNVLQEKEQLIREYLKLVTQSDRLKLRNMYLQDYLYKLCFRKNLLYENTETQRTASFHARAMSKSRNQQRKLNKKIKTHFQAFVAQRNKRVEPPPFRIRKEDKKKRENRLRRLLHHKLRAPEFEKKVDTRIIKFSKKQYRREFRSLCRNWTKRVELDEEKLVAQKAAQHLQEMKNPQKKIQTGIKMGQARKPRVLVEKAGKPIFIVSKDGKVIDAAGNVVDIRKKDAEDDTESKATETKGRCTGTKLPEESVHSHSANSASSAFRTNTASKVRTQVPGSNDDDRKRKTFANRSKSRLYFEGRSLKNIASSPNNHHHHQDIAKKLEKLKKLNGKTGYKIPCKHKKKRFAKLGWFKDDRLNGRKSLGESLQLAEKRHVIHFVEDAILNLPQRKKVAKLRLKQQAHSDVTNWDDAMERLIKLLKDCWELQLQHKKCLEEKFADWGLWEKRNYLCVDGLAVLFKSFVLQPYLSKGLLRSFYKDITEFTNHLNASHSALMRQLIKMYRNKMSLVMIERKLKDTSNPALVNNGYTAEEYSAMTQDNDLMYQKLCKIEQQLQDERQTLARCSKHANVSHDRKHTLKKLISNYKVQSLILSDVTIKKANKIQHLKDRWNTTMDQNWNLFFKGSLFEKPNLLHDFGIRKLSMYTNDRDRKALKRELYLRRREQKSMHIKMVEVKARLRDLQIEGIQNQTKSVFQFHTNNIAKSGINRFVSLSVAHCDSNLFEDYKKIKLRKAPSSNPEKLDQWF